MGESMMGLNVQVIVYHLVNNCVYYMFIILKMKTTCLLPDHGS